MTVFLTQNVVSALPLTSSNPYIVVMTNSGLVVGSSSLAVEDLINGQQSIAVWGDDSQTQEVDGAITGKEFYFQLVDSNSLYDLDISFSGPNNFTANSQLVALGVTYNFICSDQIIGDVLGCTDSSALNYNPDATVDDGSCAFDIFGCTDSSALNYNPDATVDDGLCTFDIDGCTDTTALNYNPQATLDNGSCDYGQYSCVFPEYWQGNTGSNMTVFLTQDVVSALPLTSSNPYIVVLANSGLVVGSSSLADEDLIDGQQYISVWGDDTETPEIDGLVSGETLTFQFIDGVSLYDLEISFAGVNAYATNAILPALSLSYNLNCSPNFGCMDENAFNYDEEATTDDGSCVPFVDGCTDDSFLEFDSLANVDDGSCLTDIIYGCTTVWFVEYNENANVDDGSCNTVAIYGCTDSNYIEFDVHANVDDGSCNTLIVEGCTDVFADNYDF